jgi:4-hydroxybenzoate polyprenyltransferase
MLTMKPLQALLSDIKFSHTVFALPFAFLAATMAGTLHGAPNWSRFSIQLLFVLICMVLARTSAMLANRILDRAIDKTNPRTAQRALPSGRASTKTAIILCLIINVLFIAATSAFGLMWDNWVPLALSIPVLGWLSVYPILKRFTWLCHIYLGASLAISPIAAAIAVQPEALEHLPVWLLSSAVLCWVAGFDIIYALQDVDCDIRDQLKSMPASLGIKPAMLMSQVLHCLSIAFLFGVATSDSRLGWLFQGAIVLAAAILIVEHLTVKKWGTTKIALTFFTLNGIVSLVLGGTGILDLLT